MGRWLASPFAAPAVARWAQDVDLVDRLPPERRAPILMLANWVLANQVAAVSGDDPAAIRALLHAKVLPDRTPDA